MYLFITDETNAEPTVEGKFFIFGGVIVDVLRIKDLDTEIRQIRNEAGYQDGDLLKFDSRKRPTCVTLEKFNRAKEEILDLSVKNGVIFVAYLVHHKIIKQDLKIESAINHHTSAFNKFLGEKDSFGLCLYDRIPKVNDQFDLLKENFANGLTLQNSKRIKLDHIMLHAVSCAGASNISSIADIVLGAFRYCVNSPKNEIAAKSMIKKISSMIWGERKDGHIYCINRGLILRPYKPQAIYKKDYEELVTNINTLLSDN